MDQLWDSVAFLHNDLTGPVSEHLMPILHAGGYSWGEDSHGLSHDGTSLHSVSLQQTVEHLKTKTFVGIQVRIMIYKKRYQNHLNGSAYSFRRELDYR